jgi:hypothetical protein
MSLGSAAWAGRSVLHFLHFASSGGLKAPQDGHFFIMSSNDGGLKHMEAPLLLVGVAPCCY